MTVEDQPDRNDEAMHAGAGRLPSYVTDYETRPMPFAAVYLLSLLGASALVTPLPAVVAIILASRLYRRRTRHAAIGLGISVAATLVGTLQYVHFLRT